MIDASDEASNGASSPDDGAVDGTSPRPVRPPPPPLDFPDAEASAAKLLAAAEGWGLQGLPVEIPAALVRYLRAMLTRNQSINLTAIRDFDAALMLHALDSMAIALLRTAARVESFLDLGTGNGFPGVGVAALFPDVDGVLLDRTGKKIRAIAECLVEAGMDRVTAIQGDAQQLHATHPELIAASDLVTVRAVAGPEQALRLAAPLVTRKGRIALWLETETEIPATFFARGTKGTWILEAVREYALPEPVERTRKIALYTRH